MATDTNKPAVFVVGDSEEFKTSTASLFKTENLDVRPVPFGSLLPPQDMPPAPSCIIFDATKPGASVLQFQSTLRRAKCCLPILCVTDRADIAAASGDSILMAAVRSALSRDAQRRKVEQSIDGIKERYSTLTSREREVISLVSEGLMNKQIAWELGVSEITVKVHRSNAIRKMGAKSFAELIRMLDHLYGYRDRVYRPDRGGKVAAELSKTAA